MMKDTIPKMRITTTKRTNQAKGTMKENMTKGIMKKGEFCFLFQVVGLILITVIGMTEECIA